MNSVQDFIRFGGDLRFAMTAVSVQMKFRQIKNDKSRDFTTTQQGMRVV